MPEFGALEALAVIRELALDIPVIVLSGTVGEEIAVATMRSGAHDYLMKDNLTRLVPAIERELEEAINRKARRQAEAELRYSEERFRSLVDHLPMMIWELDTEGRCVYVNRYWSVFTGTPIEAAQGDGWHQAIHEKDQERVVESFKEAIAARHPLFFEFRRLHCDGLFHWIEAAAVPRFEIDGTFKGFMGFSRDGTEQKMLREQLFEARKIESLGTVAGAIAHDFNNLLTPISGNAQLALLYANPDSEVAEFLNNILTAVGRASGLAKQLLLYAHRQKIEVAAVDLNDVFSSLEWMLRHSIGEAYTLTLAFDPEPCRVAANISHMEQILLNLVLNARDAMPGGGSIVVKTAHVLFEENQQLTGDVLVSGEYVLFTVQDTGTGIPEEILQHIFEPFFTTKAVGQGTGLGLATCYRIVKENAGAIRAESEPGKGTTFSVYLPCCKEKSGEG